MATNAFNLEDNSAEPIDYTLVVPGRRLIATFQPQQWIHDYAADSPAVEIDVTDAYLALTPEERAEIRDNKDSSDNLQSHDVWKEHGGPGYVTVEDEIREFHEPVRDFSAH